MPILEYNVDKYLSDLGYEEKEKLIWFFGLVSTLYPETLKFFFPFLSVSGEKLSEEDPRIQILIQGFPRIYETVLLLNASIEIGEANI